MTIVVSGFALPRVNSYSAPVAYGLTLKAGSAPPSSAVIAAASIENWYAIDMRIKRRRPITPAEFAMLREFIQVRDRVKKLYLRNQRQLRRLNIQFSALVGNRVVDSYQPIRLPSKGDYSGLVPLKRASMRNRNTRTATLRRNGERAAGR